MIYVTQSEWKENDDNASKEMTYMQLLLLNWTDLLIWNSFY